MAYSTDLADLLAAQLTRFVTLNRHQLAGQVANLDFWLAEVAHGFDVIDRYGERFARLEAAQQAYVARHGTVEYAPTADGTWGSPARTPKRVPDRGLRKSRLALADTAYRFLVRCRDEHLLNPDDFQIACGRLRLDPVTGRDLHGR